MQLQCPRCKGTGLHNGFQCALCDGKGHEEEKIVNAYKERQHAPFWNQDDHRREKG